VKIQFTQVGLVTLCAVVIGLVGTLQVLTRRLEGFDLFQRLEWMKLRLGVRLATNSTMVCAPNLVRSTSDNDTIGRFSTAASAIGPAYTGLVMFNGHVIQELTGREQKRSVSPFVRRIEGRITPYFHPDGQEDFGRVFFARQIHMPTT